MIIMVGSMAAGGQAGMGLEQKLRAQLQAERETRPGMAYEASKPIPNAIPSPTRPHKFILPK